MTKMRYITIQEWMLELGIGGNDLLAYALVWGFCQDGKSCFRGSYDYLIQWLGCSRRTVFDVLARLEDRGLIRKETTEVNGVRFCNLYALIPDECNFCTGGANSAQGSADSALGGGANSAPHNNSKHNATNVANRDNNKPPYNSPFDFYKALLNYGVSEETAKAWLAVRKAKRCVNTELAFHETMEEVRKSGQSAEQCIRFAAARSWAGFRADWMQNELNGADRGALRPKHVDNITFMIEQRKRRLAEEAAQEYQYNPNDDLPDEQ